MLKPEQTFAKYQDGVFLTEHGRGRGHSTFNNGDVYEGEYMDGMRHGSGVYRYVCILHTMTFANFYVAYLFLIFFYIQRTNGMHQ